MTERIARKTHRESQIRQQNRPERPHEITKINSAELKVGWLSFCLDGTIATLIPGETTIR